MATIKIMTTDEEQWIVLETLKRVQDTAIPVSKLSEMCGLPQSRVRYALVDLEDDGKIKRVVTRAFNKHYKRYKYIIL